MEFSCLILLSIISFSSTKIVKSCKQRLEKSIDDIPNFQIIFVNETLGFKNNKLPRREPQNRAEDFDRNNFYIKHYYERQIESPFIDDISFFGEEMSIPKDSIVSAKSSFKVASTKKLTRKYLSFRTDITENLDEDFNVFDTLSLSDGGTDGNVDDFISPEECKEIVDAHNKYRSNFNSVTPLASDMKYMEYSEFLEAKAKDYVQACKYNKNTPYGLNVYIGTNRNFTRALWLWYSESKWYAFENMTCSERRMCGHFTQMLWADSHLVGCARKSHCFPRYSGHIFLSCLYFPAGNYLRFPPFRVGLPCTRCGTKDGNLCHQKLCVTRRQCEALDLKCSCKTLCRNCAEPNPSTCRCETCGPGWDWEDCSFPCKDELNAMGRHCPITGQNSFCGETIPGKLCRRSCGFCETVNSSNSMELCCEGKVCEPYHVLDASCECVLDCPSRLCLNYISSKNQTSARPNNFTLDLFDKPANVSPYSFKTKKSLFKNSDSKVHRFQLVFLPCFIVICIIQIKYI